MQAGFGLLQKDDRTLRDVVEEDKHREDLRHTDSHIAQGGRCVRGVGRHAHPVQVRSRADLGQRESIDQPEFPQPVRDDFLEGQVVGTRLELALCTPRGGGQDGVDGPFAAWPDIGRTRASPVVLALRKDPERSEVVYAVRQVLVCEFQIAQEIRVPVGPLDLGREHMGLDRRRTPVGPTTLDALQSEVMVRMNLQFVRLFVVRSGRGLAYERVVANSVAQAPREESG